MSNDAESSSEDQISTDCAPLDNNESLSVTLGINPLSNVQLLVGPDQRSFQVNELLICTFCHFFRNAFTGSFVEAKTKILVFPDDEPERFVELIKWLYDDDIPHHGQSWKELANMWLFADKYHIDKLQNAVMDALYLKFAAHEEGVNISFETLDFIAENTAQNRSSPLRRIFANILTNGISLQQLPNRLDQIPPEFLQDMVLALKRTVSLNGPTNISLLTDPISSYYSSDNTIKANAKPASPPPVSEQSSNIYCDGIPCRQRQPPEPIRGFMHVCTNHNLTLCQDCRHSHRGHRKKLFTFTTGPYRDAITGPSLIVDGHINDSGFYCDGPKCDPEQKRLKQETWALMSGDRYHCLTCENIDYCSVCVRGELECKNAGHPLLRIRPTFAKQVPLTEQVNIKLRQERESRGACWRCGCEEHNTGECAESVVLGEDVPVED
jgi:hypothetical protein